MIKIDEYDETSLDDVRRQLYEGERRGIQQEAGELFRRYYSSAYEFRPNQQREGVEGVRNSGDNGYGERGSGEASSIEEGLNESKSYSLKNEYWKTDLTKSQLKTVDGCLRQIGNPESTRITDTANWYKGRINGKDLFVIYSAVYANDPTILYEVKGGNANIERDILMDLLEVIENGESTIGIQRNIDRLLSDDWVQEKHDMANNDVGSRGRGSNTGYASVLQGKSSNFTGSQAFRNVIRNLFEIQKRDGEINEDKNFSLKENGNISSKDRKELLDLKEKGLYLSTLYFDWHGNHLIIYGWQEKVRLSNDCEERRTFT